MIRLTEEDLGETKLTQKELDETFCLMCHHLAGTIDMMKIIEEMRGEKISQCHAKKLNTHHIEEALKLVEKMEPYLLEGEE